MKALAAGTLRLIPPSVRPVEYQTCP
jgi:hypothetical protein